MKRRRFLGVRFTKAGKGRAVAKVEVDKKRIGQLEMEKKKFISLGDFDKARSIDLHIKSLKANGRSGRDSIGRFE